MHRTGPHAAIWSVLELKYKPHGSGPGGKDSQKGYSSQLKSIFAEGGEANQNIVHVVRHSSRKNAAFCPASPLATTDSRPTDAVGRVVLVAEGEHEQESPRAMQIDIVGVHLRGSVFRLAAKN
eukprot:677072-Prymnesium_polylepis.1